jgi:alanine racemase
VTFSSIPPDAASAGAILHIDLGAIRENYRRLRAMLRPEATCSAVVKADGYGLGASEIASALIEEGCGHFFVAHASEGLSLSAEVGTAAKIYVLNGIPAGAEDECARAGLIAVANSAGQLHAWRAAARRVKRILPVAVQVDTGMSRLGMSLAEVDGLEPGDFDGLEPVLAMSHLACADEPDNPANGMQRNTFEVLRKKLPAMPASLANSSGIFLGEDFHYDLVRPGVALYGVNPVPGRPNPMDQTVRLRAKVIQTRDLAADIGVGYGHAFRTTAPSRTATIALGYADGWPRRAGAAAWLGDTRLPFAGRVSMDLIILDISAIPDGRLKPGDTVELIGPQQSIDEVAAISGTIGYEILTSLGNRFWRVYEDA